TSTSTHDLAFGGSLRSPTSRSPASRWHASKRSCSSSSSSTGSGASSPRKALLEAVVNVVLVGRERVKLPEHHGVVIRPQDVFDPDVLRMEAPVGIREIARLIRALAEEDRDGVVAQAYPQGAARGGRGHEVVGGRGE